MTATLVLTLGLALAAQGGTDDGLPPDFDADGLPADVTTEAPADAPPPPPTTGDKPPADGDPDKIEFVGDENGEANLENLPLPQEEEIPDSEPPVIDDLAVAAQNPNAGPYVTAVITDDVSGVAAALVYTRAQGTDDDFRATPMVANDGGLFLAQLPNGLQKTGFEYYVEVTDARGNGPTRIGSEDKPLSVEPAGMGELAREKIPVAGTSYAVHPAWVMIALGAGVIAAGVSGIFWYDATGLFGRRVEIEDTLGGGGLTPADVSALEVERGTIDQALLGDAIIGGTLTALGLVALGTGVGMLVANELE